MTRGGGRLLADIGGTNARFAVSKADAPMGGIFTLRVADYISFAAALAAVVARFGRDFTEVAIAAAGLVEAGSIRLTNAAWTIRADVVREAIPGAAVGLFNDLEAVALALARLERGDTEILAPGALSQTVAPLLAVNVGTGFGAALALPGRCGWRALPSEAGHMRFAAATTEEARLAASAATYEDVLSGRGFAGLKEVFPDPETRRRVFSGLLGRVAGDLALATGAWGGVYFCGGVLSTWSENIDIDCLTTWFRDKGPMRARMAAIPLHRLVRPEPALLGLAHASLGAMAGAGRAMPA